MATLYMAAAGGNWNGANWALTPGGIATNTPTAADDCVLDASSGNVTINSGSVCRSFTVNGFTGTVTHTSAINLAIGDGTAGAGNKALDFVTTGWTYTLGNATSSSMTFISTSATQQTVNFNGKVCGNLTFQGIGSSWILGSALNMSAATLVITQCSFDSANYNIDTGTFNSSGSSARSVTLGTSVVSLYAAGTPWTTNTITNLTFSGASATIVIASASTTDRTFAGGGLTFGTLTYNNPTSQGRLIVTGANTFDTLNFGSARTVRLPASTTSSVTNFNATGANNTASNGFIYSGGSTYAASIPDSAAVSIADDFDIRIRMAQDDWSLSGAQRFVGKYFTTGNQRTWRLYNTAGALTLDMSTDGSASSAPVASATLQSVGFSNGSTYWIRVTREKSTGNVKFYYAADSTTMPSSWTQLGSTRTGTTSSLFDSTALLTIGGEQGGTNSAPGKYYWFQIRNNILDDGSGIQADIKFSDKTWGQDTFTEASSNTATVTMNGLAVYGDGRIYIESSSAGSAATISKSSGVVSCDYLQLKDSAASGGASFYAGANSIDVSGNTGWAFTPPPGVNKPEMLMVF